MQSQLQMFTDAPEQQAPVIAMSCIVAGDIVSVINKSNLDHKFMEVISFSQGCIEAVTRGACHSGGADCFYGLDETQPSCFESLDWAIVKTDNKNPKAEYVKAGLAQQHSQQLAKLRLQQLGKT